MIDLSRKLTDVLVYEGESYPLDISFGNILRIFEMFGDKTISDLVKFQFALLMLTGVNFEIDAYAARDLYQAIFDEHIKIKKIKKQHFDRQGNPLPEMKSEDDDKIHYSLTYDGDYIFASFMQAYGIDLIEVQDTLHWQKFNALLSGLPDGTKFVEVIKIRAWEPINGESASEKERMRKLQVAYELPT
ncbi:bacteriophage Gp15 family protein [Pseudolactococcus yaeyamensis]